MGGNKEYENQEVLREGRLSVKANLTTLYPTSSYLSSIAPMFTSLMNSVPQMEIDNMEISPGALGDA